MGPEWSVRAADYQQVQPERGGEEKILTLYACETSYAMQLSPELVGKISEKIMPEVPAWQNRSREAVYPFVFLDAIHYKVKQDYQYQTKAAYLSWASSWTAERISRVVDPRA